MNLVDLFWHIAQGAGPDVQALIGLRQRWKTASPARFPTGCEENAKTKPSSEKKRRMKRFGHFLNDRPVERAAPRQS
jgi:hypothetical protein